MADEPITPTAPAEPAPAPAPAPSTVLGTPEPKPADPAVEPKPGDPPKVEDKKPDPAPAIDAKALKLPEGFTADEAVLKSATDILLDDKLSPQDRMQKLVDFHAAELKKASEASSKYWGDLQTEWQAKAKETYGPEPAKSPKIVAVSKLIDSLGEKPASELRDALEMSGMGNHPAIIAAFVNLAERLGEPKHVSGNPPSNRPANAAEAIYGKGTT
jgi:hypothetical protein